jgi:hypothetical protein
MEQVRPGRFHEGRVRRTVVAVELRLPHELEKDPRDVGAGALHPAEESTRFRLRWLAIQQVFRETLSQAAPNGARLQDSLERALSRQSPALEPLVEAGDEPGGEWLVREQGCNLTQERGVRVLRVCPGDPGRRGQGARHRRPLFQAEDLRPESLPPALLYRTQSHRVRLQNPRQTRSHPAQH